MNTGGPAPKPKPLVRSDELLAGTIREQGRAVMRWAAALRRAQLAGDWSQVEEVTRDIASCATGLACFAADLEVRAKR
jgi:hypothetical protein